jgi:hypothetical protein
MKIPRAALCAPVLINAPSLDRNVGVSFRPRAKTGVGFAGQPKLQTRSGSAGVCSSIFSAMKTAAILLPIQRM